MAVFPDFYSTPKSEMLLIERYIGLMEIDSEEKWCRELFGFGQEMGFDHTLLAVLPKPGMRLEQAFLRSNYASAWRAQYDSNNLSHVDPTVAHCITRSTPLVWSPEIFQSEQQKHMYEEACAYGLCSGVTLPFHGPRGELGILCFVNDACPGPSFQRDLAQVLPHLTLLRDMAFESSLGFAGPAEAHIPVPSLTPREHECLQWTAAGKSTWEIAKILSCSEAVVNFHIANVRQKFDVSTRREAVVKAIRLGIIRVD